MILSYAITSALRDATLILLPDDTQGIVAHVLEIRSEWTDEQRRDPDWASYQKGYKKSMYEIKS